MRLPSSGIAFFQPDKIIKTYTLPKPPEGYRSWLDYHLLRESPNTEAWLNARYELENLNKIRLKNGDFSDWVRKLFIIKKLYELKLMVTFSKQCEKRELSILDEFERRLGLINEYYQKDYEWNPVLGRLIEKRNRVKKYPWDK